MTRDEALKAASLYLYESEISPQDDTDVKELATLILDERQSAVESARPEIERKAKIDALRWVLSCVNIFSDFERREYKIKNMIAKLEKENVR